MEQNGPLGSRQLILPVTLGVLLGLVMVCAGLFIDLPGVGSGVLTIGGAAVSACFLLIGLGFGLFLRSGEKEQELIRAIVNMDDMPIILTDLQANEVYRNDASRTAYPQMAFEECLRSHFASPHAVIERLRTEGVRKGTAGEETYTAKGVFRVQVRHQGRDLLLWRLQAGGAQGAAPGETTSLPMLSAGPTGTVLHMNEAFRKLYGGRAKSLDAVFTHLPVMSGQLNRIETVDGPLDALVAEVDGSGGRKELYVLPRSANLATASGQEGAWSEIEDLPVPLMQLGLDGSILACNKGARGLLGIGVDETLKLSDRLDGLGRSVPEWIGETSSGRCPQQTEFLRGAGARRDLFVQLSICQSLGGEVPHVIGVLQDMTEFKALEAQFVQSQKMQAIGQLAGGIAHDFNNLLTAISGHCDLLLLRHEPNDPDYADLNQIHQNTNRAASLVSQLLAYSRKQELRLTTMDLRDTLSDLTHLLNRLVGERVSLTLNHEPKLFQVQADKRQLEQVLMNLVVNARDAMEDGGEIRIETQNLSMEQPMARDRASVPAGDYVLIRVTDQGRGIPPEMMAHIFEPFYTTKGVGEGTGLGLSTAYGIVKQSGGYIFADSVPGEGATFSILLPADRQDEERGADMHDLSHEPQRETGKETGVVLLVEDEAPVRAFASRALRLRGYEVIEADSAESALEVLEDTDLQIDLFVTDVVMPGKDGPTWVREALDTRPDTKVVFMSGYSEDGIRENRAAVPNSVFLPKPFSLSDLTRTVQQQLY